MVEPNDLPDPPAELVDLSGFVQDENHQEGAANSFGFAFPLFLQYVAVIFRIRGSSSVIRGACKDKRRSIASHASTCIARPYYLRILMLACLAWKPSLRAGDLHPLVPSNLMRAVKVMRDGEPDFGSIMRQHIFAEVLSCHAGACNSHTLPRGVGDGDLFVHRSARVSRWVVVAGWCCWRRRRALLKPSRRRMTKTLCARANHRNDSMSLISQQIRNFE